MKLKNNKVTLNLAYEAENEHEFNKLMNLPNNEKLNFSIIDTETILLKTEKDEFPLHLKHLNAKDRNCLIFLQSVKDLHKLQLQYELKHDKLEIEFFTTRLNEEEFDKELFAKSISVTDVDSKVLIGLFLDNRFHG